MHLTCLEPLPVIKVVMSTFGVETFVPHVHVTDVVAHASSHIKQQLWVSSTKCCTPIKVVANWLHPELQCAASGTFAGCG